MPWAMRSKSGGLIGYEIDVATQLAKDMNVAPAAGRPRH